MTIRRLELLQWFGFLAGGAVWFTAFIAGVGTSVAVCNPASRRWGIPVDTVEIALLAVAAALVCFAEGAAVLVYRATRDADEQGAPPRARMKLVAIAAMAGNLVFLAIIVLSAIATLANPLCHQA